MKPRVLAALLALVALLAVAVLVVASTPAHASTQAWCNYPEPASVAALDAHVGQQLADIHRYSPDVHADRLTLAAAALAQCGPFTG